MVNKTKTWVTWKVLHCLVVQNMIVEKNEILCVTFHLLRYSCFVSLLSGLGSSSYYADAAKKRISESSWNKKTFTHYQETYVLFELTFRTFSLINTIIYYRNEAHSCTIYISTVCIMSIINTTLFNVWFSDTVWTVLYFMIYLKVNTLPHITILSSCLNMALIVFTNLHQVFSNIFSLEDWTYFSFWFCSWNSLQIIFKNTAQRYWLSQIARWFHWFFGLCVLEFDTDIIWKNVLNQQFTLVTCA